MTSGNTSTHYRSAGCDPLAVLSAGRTAATLRQATSIRRLSASRPAPARCQQGQRLPDRDHELGQLRELGAIDPGPGQCGRHDPTLPVQHPEHLDLARLFQRGDHRGREDHNSNATHR
jgi:hypothetical protein